MKVARFVVNPFGENTYIVWSDSTREAAIIDPGMIKPHEVAAVDNYVSENSLKVTKLLFTHLHLDHAFGAEHVMEKYGVVASSSAEERVLGECMQRQADRFHLRAEMKNVDIVDELHDGDTITLGDEDITVIKVPGHSPGGLAFYCKESALLFTGDILFAGSIGRTDLAGGNMEQLLTGIKEKLLTLPEETLVCPGHGDTTTIGSERDCNQFLA